MSIYQPHVRPIVRGKSKGKVEFGVKIGVCVDNGYARIDHLSRDAYNESEDLMLLWADHQKSLRQQNIKRNSGKRLEKGMKLKGCLEQPKENTR